MDGDGRVRESRRVFVTSCGGREHSSVVRTLQAADSGAWRVEERTAGRGKCDVRPEQELLAALEAGDMPTDGVLLWHVLQSAMKKKKKKKKKNGNENKNKLELHE